MTSVSNAYSFTPTSLSPTSPPLVPAFMHASGTPAPTLVGPCATQSILMTAAPITAAAPTTSTATGILYHSQRAPQSGIPQSTSTTSIPNSSSTNSLSGDGKLQRKPSQKWSADEDARLVEAVQMYNGRRWAKIAEIVGSKDKIACYQHWFRVLNPQISKTKFSDAEYCRLGYRIKLYGTSAWCKVAEGMYGRTDTQCRARWLDIQKGSTPLWKTLKRLILGEECEDYETVDKSAVVSADEMKAYLEREFGVQIVASSAELDGGGCGGAGGGLSDAVMQGASEELASFEAQENGKIAEEVNACLRSSWKRTLKSKDHGGNAGSVSNGAAGAGGASMPSVPGKRMSGPAGGVAPVIGSGKKLHVGPSLNSRSRPGASSRAVQPKMDLLSASVSLPSLVSVLSSSPMMDPAMFGLMDSSDAPYPLAPSNSSASSDPKQGQAQRPAFGSTLSDSVSSGHVNSQMLQNHLFQHQQQQQHQHQHHHSHQQQQQQRQYPTHVSFQYSSSSGSYIAPSVSVPNTLSNVGMVNGQFVSSSSSSLSMGLSSLSLGMSSEAIELNSRPGYGRNRQTGSSAHSRSSSMMEEEDEDLLQDALLLSGIPMVAEPSNVMDDFDPLITPGGMLELIVSSPMGTSAFQSPPSHLLSSSSSRDMHHSAVGGSTVFVNPPTPLTVGVGSDFDEWMRED
eukprot:ANDGO_00392.mRNA.1 Myb-related protein 3R-1